MPAPMDTNSRGWPIPNADPEDLVPQIQAMEEAISGDIAASGPLILSADATAVSSNTLTAQTGLSRDVISGVVYSFTVIVWLVATSAEGWQIDLNGGSALMLWIKGGATGYDFLLSDGTANANASLALTRGIDTLATNLSPQDGWSGMVEIKGSFEPSSDGTFIPQIAQVAHASGSVQVLKGSSIEVR